MRMRTDVAALFTILLVAAGCDTFKPDRTTGGSGPALPMELELRQVSRLPAAAEHISGQVPVRFLLKVENRSAEPATLKRVQLDTIGFGAYSLRGAVGTAFNQVIAPGKTEAVELWVPAEMGNTVSGGNGPVSVRITATFDWKGGGFQKISVQQVSAL